MANAYLSDATCTAKRPLVSPADGEDGPSTSPPTLIFLSLPPFLAQSVVSDLHSKHGATLGRGDDSEEVAAALRLLLVHAEVAAGVGRLEADIRCEGRL